MGTLLTHSKNGRTAFILNANAKCVSGNLLNKLIEMVPTGDLYLSRSFQDAHRILKTILEKGYEQVFSGGGDGTLMNTISTIQELCEKQRGLLIPRIGVLRLGTGNAVASILGAKKPLLDVNHVISGGRFEKRELQMIRCEDGSLAPFAGIGLDGEVLNDYVELRKAAQGKLSDKLYKTAFGYVWAGITRTAPRHSRKPHPMVRITSKTPSTRVVSNGHSDVEVEVAANSVLFEGPASMVSVGSIPCFGYGFQMFPHLKGGNRKKMQLRVCTASVWPILSNLYPSLWKGTYRGEYVFDYLLDQVTIESDESLPYQVAGDARGFRKELSFTIAESAVGAVELDKSRLPFHSGAMRLLPAYALAR